MITTRNSICPKESIRKKTLILFDIAYFFSCRKEKKMPDSIMKTTEEGVVGGDEDICATDGIPTITKVDESSSKPFHDNKLKHTMKEKPLRRLDSNIRDSIAIHHHGSGRRFSSCTNKTVASLASSSSTTLEEYWLFNDNYCDNDALEGTTESRSTSTDGTNTIALVDHVAELLGKTISSKEPCSCIYNNSSNEDNNISLFVVNDDQSPQRDLPSATTNQNAVWLKRRRAAVTAQRKQEENSPLRSLQTQTPLDSEGFFLVNTASAGDNVFVTVENDLK